MLQTEYYWGGGLSNDYGMWEVWKRNAYIFCVGKPEGNKSLGRSRRRWEGNINMDLREMAGVAEWICLLRI